jgi:hypothetical protein
MSWLESLVDNEVRCQPWVCHGCLWAAMALAVPCVATDKRGMLRFDMKVPYRILCLRIVPAPVVGDEWQRRQTDG